MNNENEEINIDDIPFDNPEADQMAKKIAEQLPHKEIDDKELKELRDRYIHLLVSKKINFIRDDIETYPHRRREIKMPGDWYNEAETSGSVKLWNYFVDKTETDEIQDWIKNIRKALYMPEDGLQKNGKIENEIFRVLRIVTEEHTPYSFDEVLDFIDYMLYSMCVIDYELNWWEWEYSFRHYLFFNEFLKPDHYTHLLRFYDVKSLASESANPVKYFSQINTSERISFPIALGISPYATKNDIIDFVEKMYPHIHRMQKNYKNVSVSIGSHRSRKNRERDNFIYRNRKLPIKKLLSIVSEEFGRMDEGALRKIISIEIKRRKGKNEKKVTPT